MKFVKPRFQNHNYGTTVLGGIETPAQPIPVCVEDPWWEKTATVVGALASVATLWMAWNWSKMMKKKTK